MDKSKTIITNPVTLAEMRTWQSGVLQSSMHRGLKKASDEYLKQYDLSTMHWYIIGTIHDAGVKGIRITDLAETVGTTLGYLTNAVNSLELKGIVQRTDHSTDSRTKLLNISPSYQDQLFEIEEGMRDLLRTKLYGKISRDELQTFITVLQKLSDI